MAKATKVPQDYEVTLTLSRKEAETLRFILSRIGGHPLRTPRGFISAIADAMDEAGVMNIDLRVLCGAERIHFAE